VGIEDWGETWIKEGLATYMEILWLDRNDPDAAAARLAEIEAEVAEKGHAYPLDQPPRDRVLSFDSYYRGTLVIHALHEEIGDEAFFAGLRIFLERYGGGNAGFEDFRSAMEEAAGQSLDGAFARWLAASGFEGEQP
jgi:aminopeptidase N